MNIINGVKVYGSWKEHWDETLKTASPVYAKWMLSQFDPYYSTHQHSYACMYKEISKIPFWKDKYDKIRKDRILKKEKQYGN